MSEDSGSGVTDNVAGETMTDAKTNVSSKPASKINPIARPKKTPQIKPYSLLNLKSPTYDSSNQLNKGFDPNHKFENYGHGLNAKVRLEQQQQPLRKQITTRSPGSAGAAAAAVNVLKKSDVSEKPKRVEEDAAEDDSSDLEEEENVQAKPTPKITVNKKSPNIKPFNMMSLKSPTYDSSNQLNKAFDGEQHGKVKPLSLGAQMMRKKIHQRPNSNAPKKQFVQSQPASASKKEEEVKAKPVISDVPKLDPNSLNRPKPKFPFSLKNLKSPTYDSSTLLNQAFDPNHKFEDYAHGTTDKVELKKKEIERQELKKQVTSRSDASATSPRSDISSVDSIPISPVTDVSSPSENANKS